MAPPATFAPGTCAPASWSGPSTRSRGKARNTATPGRAIARRSGVNAWGFLAVNGKAASFSALGAPSVDQYGGDRAGDNLFSTSLVAADAGTGKYLWHFQVVHHDIWDANDGRAALIDVKQGDKTIPAVVAMDKVGLVFLLNRVNGKPI